MNTLAKVGLVIAGIVIGCSFRKSEKKCGEACDKMTKQVVKKH